MLVSPKLSLWERLPGASQHDHALGSVRQMANASGGLTLARSYDPYGTVRDTSHLTPDTSYGFTGEFTETTGMVYLRARHYSPQLGRFMTRDTWEGDQGMPMSYNRWAYVYGNPVNMFDPSGHIPSYCFYLPSKFRLGIPECRDDYIPPLTIICPPGGPGVPDWSDDPSDDMQEWKKRILDRFGIIISDEHDQKWAIDNIRFAYSALANIDGALNSHLKSFLGGTKYFYHQDNTGAHYKGITRPQSITFFFASNTKLPHQLIYHEMGHLLNHSLGNKFDHDLENNQYYADGKLVMGTIPGTAYNRQNYLGYTKATLNDPSGMSVDALMHPAGAGDIDGKGNTSYEDWGDMFANYVAGNIDRSKPAGQLRFNWTAERIWRP